MSGMRSKDAGAFARHLQRDETSRCFCSFCVVQPRNEDTKDQMPRLLASAVHVPPQMYDMHQVSWPQMPRPELREGHRNFALHSIAGDRPGCADFRLHALQICALHRHASRWH